MEHIVQFGISIDDDAIKKRMEESGYNDIIKKLTNECKSELCKLGYHKSYTRDDINWSKFTQDHMYKWMNEHKDEIIDAAAKKMKDSFIKSKAFKDTMTEVVKEV